MSHGVLFIATGGKQYRDMANLAARSVSKWNPNLSIHMHFEEDGAGLDSRNAKLRMYQISPFDQTIYLDCDVLVNASLAPLFQMAYTRPHVAMSLDAGPKTAGEVLQHRWFHKTAPFEVMRRLERRVLPMTPHFNSGVVSFNKSREAESFFAHWSKVWHSREKAQDQLALMESCSKRNIFPSLIPYGWNYQHCITKAETALLEDRPHIQVLHLAGIKKGELYQRAQRSGFLP